MSKTKAPYGQTFPLLSDLPNVECWNRTDGALFTLPKGTLLEIEHAYDAMHTTCMTQGLKKNASGSDIPLFPGCYRFIVENQKLGEAIGVQMPKKTADLVGDIIAYETGNASPQQTKRLFRTLKKTGIGKKLQGHYSSRM